MAPICSFEMRPSMPAVGSACTMCSSPPAQNTTICWLVCAHHHGHHHHGHHQDGHHHCRPPHHWAEHRLTVGLCPWPIRCVGSGKRGWRWCGSAIIPLQRCLCHPIAITSHRKLFAIAITSQRANFLPLPLPSCKRPQLTTSQNLPIAIK